ncbi:CLUMA_CG020267, isoform A [Clunio marinus]|uniref:CLUMA_CG020267, isoform A n=1 Tax=Clunio marinus TaxID=568069 RepID=A0A1J1J4G1_9DIPT|nr:CLUMA_CG020267, isoform A [Clunio marinus]
MNMKLLKIIELFCHHSLILHEILIQEDAIFQDMSTFNFWFAMSETKSSIKMHPKHVVVVMRAGLPMRYQNSYRLESKNPFNREQAEKILIEVMEDNFSKYDRFDAKTDVDLCQKVSEDVLKLMKEKRFDRYRIIVIVTIVEKFMQGIHYKQKNLWDSRKDCSVTHVYKAASFTAIGNCYGVYLE